MNKVINQSNFSSLLLMWGRGKQSHAACYLFYSKLLIMYLYIFFVNKKERYIFSGTLWVIPINFYVSKQNLNWSSGNIYLLAYKSLQEKPTLGWKCRWSTTVYRLSGLPSRPDYLTRMWKFKTINTWCNSVLCSMPTGKVIFQWI